MASDNSGSGEGWRVDTVHITWCQDVGCPQPTPPPRPTPAPRPVASIPPSPHATPAFTPAPRPIRDAPAVSSRTSVDAFTLLARRE
jgi:hypothetical protein